MMVLSTADRRSALWALIEKEYTERLQNLRSQNDAASLTAEQTAVLRGRIAEIKGLLALGQEPKTKAG